MTTRKRITIIAVTFVTLSSIVVGSHWYAIRTCENTCAAFGEESETRGRDRTCLCRNEDGLLYDPISRRTP